MPSAEPRTYTSPEVCAAAGASRPTFNTWLARRYVPLPPGPGTGRERRFTMFDAVRIAVMAELNRLGLAASVAAYAASRIEEVPGERPHGPLDEPGWTLILVPASRCSDHEGGPIPLAMVKYESLEALHEYIHDTFSGPASFVLLDVSAVARRVAERLEGAHSPLAGAGAKAAGRELA